MKFYLVAACALLAFTPAFADELSNEDIYLANIKTVIKSPEFDAYKKARGLDQMDGKLIGSELRLGTEEELHDYTSATHVASFRYRAGRDECVITFPVKIGEMAYVETLGPGYSDGGCGE